MFRLRRSSLFLAFCILLFLAYAFGTVYVFGAMLEDEVWEHVYGYTRIVIPDTFTYLNLTRSDNPFLFLFLSPVKNSFGPGLVWLVLQENWYLVALFNTVLFLFVLIYTRKLVVLLSLGHRARLYSMTLVLTLACMYYSVGSLKEIPTMLGLTAFVYCFLKGQKLGAVLWLLVLALFRYQFVFIILPVYLLSKLRKNPVRLVLLSLVVFGAVYPALYFAQLFMPEASQMLRLADASESLGVGTYVEHVRDKVFGLSFFAIVVRLVQSILEPLLTFLRTFSFYEQGSLSLYQLHGMLVLLVMVSAWTSVFARAFRIKADRDEQAVRFGILYSFVAVGCFAIGGTGPLSHRYLVPMYGLVLAVAYVKSRKPKALTAPQSTPRLHGPPLATAV